MPDKDTSEAYPSSWSPRATRILKIAVIVMGVMIALGFVVIVGTIFSRMGADEAPGEAAVTITDPQIAALLGPDAEVISTETDSGRLAVVLKTGAGIRILFVDMRSGRIISVIGGE